jgi:hypothetical protein
MSVTNQFSTEANRVRDPRANGNVNVAYFRDLEVMPFTFTQSGAGNATSTATLVTLQKGRYRIYPRLSYINWTAFGASRVLDIGLNAYTGEDGVAVTIADNRFDDNVDVASAGGAAMGSDLSAADSIGVDVYVGGSSNTDGASVIATVAGGTIPDAAVLRGYIVISRIP